MGHYVISLGKHRLDVRSLRDGRPRKVARVLVEGPRVYAVNDHGEFFCNAVAGNAHYPRLDSRTLPMAQAAAALGLLPKEAVAAIARQHERLDKARGDDRAADMLQAAAERLGLQLTAAQRRASTRARAAYQRAFPKKSA